MDIINLNQKLLDINGNPWGTHEAITIVDGQPLRDALGKLVKVSYEDPDDVMTLGKVMAESMLFGTHFTEKEKLTAFELGMLIMKWRREGEVPGMMPVGEFKNQKDNIKMIQDAIMKRYLMPIVSVQASNMLNPYL